MSRNIIYKCKRTVNLGNYENVVIEVGLEDTLGNETLDEAYARLRGEVDRQLKIAINEQVRPKAAQPQVSELDERSKLEETIKQLVQNDKRLIPVVQMYLTGKANKVRELKLNELRELMQILKR